MHAGRRCQMGQLFRIVLYSCFLSFFTIIPSMTSLGPPHLLPQAYDLHRVILEGTNVLLPCPVHSEPDTVFFEWYKGRQSLVFAEDRFRITTNGALRIKSTLPLDTGVYVCRAVNGFGRVDVNVTLIVLAVEENSSKTHFQELGDPRLMGNPDRPRFVDVTKFPTEVIHRPVGGSVRLKCAAIGNPEPQIFWLKNGQLLSENVLPGTAKRGRWWLHLRHLQLTDSGDYSCLVYNVHGYANTSFALHVAEGSRKKPELRGSHPVNTTVELGGTAIFQCRVKSDNPPQVKWLKRVDTDESLKIQGENYEILKSTEVVERSDGSFLNKLEIPEAEEKDSGKYICLGANAVGYSFRGAFLSVLPPHETITAAVEESSPGAPVNPLLIILPLTLGVLLAVFVAVVVRVCQKPPGTTFPAKTEPRFPEGKGSRSGGHTSEGTWSRAPSTVAMDTAHPDFFSECGSSFVFWTEALPPFYPEVIYKNGGVMSRVCSPEEVLEREYTRYLDCV